MWLVVNAGSSSVKLRVFDPALSEVAKAAVDRIGTGGPADHAQALALGLAQMGVTPGRLTAAAHRVVHGGASLRAAAGSRRRSRRRSTPAPPLRRCTTPPT